MLIVFEYQVTDSNKAHIKENQIYLISKKKTIMLCAMTAIDYILFLALFIKVISDERTVNNHEEEGYNLM